MKKIKLVFLSVIISTFFLTSCNNDEGPVDFSYLKGKWQFNYSTATSNGITIDYPTEQFKNEVNCSKDYIEILDGAIVKNGDYNSSCALDIKTGTWSQNTTDNTLTIIVPLSNLDETFKVAKLGPNELILKLDGSLPNGQSGTFTLHFTK
jgi:hypothetical protein